VALKIWVVENHDLSLIIDHSFIYTQIQRKYIASIVGNNLTPATVDPSKGLTINVITLRAG